MAAIFLILSKVIGTIFKVVLIVPIYNKIKEKYRGKNTEAQALNNQGRTEEANAILQELRFDLMSEMWTDFLYLCKGVWRTRITKKPLWMIGSVIVTFYLLKWTWGFVEPYAVEIIVSTVVVTVLWYIYKFFQDNFIVKKSVTSMNACLNRWTDSGSTWVLGIVDDQEAYEAEKKSTQAADDQVEESEVGDGGQS